MKYFSTRNRKINFNFEEIFQRGLAPDGGLFLPHTIKKFNKAHLKKLKNLSYVDLATKIVSNFCEPELKKNKLKALIKKSYKKFKKKK